MRRRDGGRAAVATHDVLQGVVHRERVVRSLVGIAREAAEQQRFEVRGQPRDPLARRDRRRGQWLEQELRLALGVEGQHTAHHLVDDDRERVDVGAPVDPDSAHVLGRDVAGGAKKLLIQGERRLTGQLGDTEVGQLHVLRLGVGFVLLHEEDVLGLEIAVDDAHLVRTRQRARHLHADARGAWPREAAALDVGKQRVTLDELHHEIRDAVGLADVGDLHDILVVDAIDGARLAEEALAVLGDQRELGPEDLDGAEARDQLVAREVDDGHAAGAEAPDEAVSRRDGAAEEAVLALLEDLTVVRTEARVVAEQIGATRADLHERKAIRLCDATSCATDAGLRRAPVPRGSRRSVQSRRGPRARRSPSRPARRASRARRRPRAGTCPSRGPTRTPDPRARRRATS